jgi:hypothetical protein
VLLQGNVHKQISTLGLIIVFAFNLNGCSSMTPQARRERAYNHYVQKCIHQRQRQMARAQKAANRQMKEKMKLARVSEPEITTSLGPEPGSLSGPAAEEVAQPITVSGSDPSAIQQPPEPSQPSRP